MGTITATSMALADGLAAVIPAAAKDGARPSINAVHLEPGPSGLRLVTADNYRLATFDIEGTADAPLLLSLDSAIAFAAELRKEKHGTVVDVTLTWADPSRVTAEWGGSMRTLRGVDATFPNYRQVLPPDDRQGDTTVGLSAAHLADAAKMLCDRRTQNLRVTFNADPFVPIVIRAQNDDRGTIVVMPVRLS